tara:strand:- start:189 stop:416 length:228 start_codon:yes stop_codon:yes gene_type:complete
MRPTYLNPKKPTMKDHLKSLWVNARSLIYAGLTLGGILVVLLGSILLLPLVLILIVGGILFFIYKLGVYNDTENF